MVSVGRLTRLTFPPFFNKIVFVLRLMTHGLGPAKTSMTLMMPATEQLIGKSGASRWTPLAVNAVASLLLTYSLAQWSWRLMEPAPVIHYQRPGPPVSHAGSRL